MPPRSPSRDRPDAEPVAGRGASHRARGGFPLALAGRGEPVQRLGCNSGDLRLPPQLYSAARPLRLADRPGGCAAGAGPLPNRRPVGRRSRHAVHGDSPALRDDYEASTDHDQVISSYEDGLKFHLHPCVRGKRDPPGGLGCPDDLRTLAGPCDPGLPVLGRRHRLNRRMVGSGATPLLGGGASRVDFVGSGTSGCMGGIEAGCDVPSMGREEGSDRPG